MVGEKIIPSVPSNLPTSIRAILLVPISMS